MFEIIPLSESVLHAQCILKSASPLPAGAIREGALDISSLFFDERPDVPARFALIENVRLTTVAGLRFEWEDTRDEEAARPRDGEARVVRVRVTNETNGALSFDTKLTFVGGALSMRPAPLAPSLPPPLLPVSWTNADLRATTLAGVDLRQAWRIVNQALQSGGGGGGSGNAGSGAGTITVTGNTTLSQEQTQLRALGVLGSLSSGFTLTLRAVPFFLFVTNATNQTATIVREGGVATDTLAPGEGRFFTHLI